jgi:methionyl-tRNA formyltransferase
MKPLHEAKVNNARIVGATTHEVIEKVDAGKIVSQAAYSPDWSDMQTEEDTLFKIGAMTLFSSLLIYNGINCNSEICMVNDNKVFLTDFHTDLMKLNSTEFWQKI